VPRITAEIGNSLSLADSGHAKIDANDRNRSSTTAFAERNLWNLPPPVQGHSGLMFAARITLAHFSVSSVADYCYLCLSRRGRRNGKDKS
jgi:hypothetical protein